MSVISAIDKHSVHKICSGQVVLDIATAVKELVENSIDAGATSVDVNFIDSGIGGIEVVDNGCGIDPLNYESLALKHYTSKITNFEDLEKVMTFGFRGEALSSLCALSHLVVITATKTQAPMGVKLEYDSAGSLKSKTPQSRTAGTTVQLTDIFHSLPVRRQEYKRNIKREFGKALIILQAYSIISTNVKITVSNQTGTKPSIKIMSTSKNKKMSDNITNIFGSKLTSQIIPFNVDLGSAIEGGGSVEGFISKPEWGLGRSTSDRQYFYVNGRPCVLSKIAKAFNDVYRIFITNQYPVVIANLKLPTDAYDVNVSPDKRTIFLHDENKISDVLQEQLKEQMEPSRSIFNVNSLMSSKKPQEEPSQPTTDVPANTTTTTSTISLPRPSPRVVSLSSFARGAAKSTPSSSSSSKRSLSSSTNSLMNYMTKKPRVDAGDDDIVMETSGQDTSMLVDASSSAPSESTELEVDELDDSSEEISTEPSSKGMTPADRDMDPPDESVSGSDSREYVQTVSNMSSFKGLWRTVGRTKTVKSIDLATLRRSQPAIITHDEASVQAPTQVLQNANDNEKAARALSRVISKPDFARMDVLGQFNLGFMITALDDQDLYIIDQHASDEKYNFETLQQTTHIKGQRLISSPILDLTAAEELTVMENLDIFKANGFDVEILPDNPPTTRIRVISQPVSKNTMFDKRDFSELIHLITEHPGEMVRCSRNRAMFASRACHKAVRIGDSLSKNQMTKIVRHMGEIDQPWNCPHGRPTMRHLLNISHFKQEYKANASHRTLQLSGTLFHTK
ncbi:postmeiotic segregation increased 2, isoform CRA_c [Mucor lusitanicus]